MKVYELINLLVNEPAGSEIKIYPDIGRGEFDILEVQGSGEIADCQVQLVFKGRAK